VRDDLCLAVLTSRVFGRLLSEIGHCLGRPARLRIIRIVPSPRAMASNERELFLKRISSETPLYTPFDCLPGVIFFAKDRRSRLICASQRFLERFGFRREAEVTGKDDFDLFPPRLAESFRRDDEEVLRTGKPKRNIVELFFNEQGVPDWYITNKFPLRDRRGKVIGLMGISHSYEGRGEVSHRDLRLDRAIAYIREHFRSGVSIKELAQAVHISPRQLHRKFVEAFGMSPQTFITKLRIQAACETLQREGLQIGEAAQAFGFCNQSSFTELFQRYVGVTPLKFQRSHRRGAVDLR
jgi:AraC-like DNA-binding protein